MSKNEVSNEENANELEIEKKKLVIGLYGEMQLSMKLHQLGWQVHRSYIDEGIDFVISRYYCETCQQFSLQYIRKEIYENKKTKCVTNLCEKCKKTPLNIVTKYLQVKTSEGISNKSNNSVRAFSFHPKIRYNIGNDFYYVWIAVFENKDNLEQSKLHYYIFNSNGINKFDDITLPTYQITDNQKTSLQINIDGKVLNKGKKYNYDCFNNEFFNNFKLLEQIKK